MSAGLVKRSFTLQRHRTSVALEAPFWTELDRIAAARGVSLIGLVTSLDAQRDPATSLASALRVLALAEKTCLRGAEKPFGD